MRYAEGHKQQTRERILAAAARLFREHGIAAVGLAKVMADAGLTVGTFSTHFASKEALVREALAPAFRLRRADFGDALAGKDLAHAVRVYLSPEHRDLPEGCCPAPALAAEIGRHPRSTRQAFAKELAPTIQQLGELLAARRKAPVDAAEASAFFGLLVGTLQLARATADRAASDALLDAGVRTALAVADAMPISHEQKNGDHHE